MEYTSEFNGRITVKYSDDERDIEIMDMGKGKHLFMESLKDEPIVNLVNTDIFGLRKLAQERRIVIESILDGGSI